jgi:hypothetical protein
MTLASVKVKLLSSHLVSDKSTFALQDERRIESTWTASLI